jgi:hypothetical protein
LPCQNASNPFLILQAFFKAVAFGVAFVMGVGGVATYGDTAFVAMVGLVVKTAMAYVATNVLIRHSRTSLNGL